MTPARWAMAVAAIVTLSWSDNSSNESGFEVYRSSNGPTGDFIVVATTGPNTEAFQDGTVEGGKTYAYKVRAFNSSGGSAFSNTASGIAVPPTGSPPDGPTAIAARVTIPGRLANVSDRGLVAVETTKVTGFSVADGPVVVLVRAVGPTIAAAPYNVAGTLADPKVWLKDAAGATIASNDDWSGADVSAAAQAAGAFPLPAGSKDAAILVTLQPGTYTAHVSGPTGTESGLVLTEVYQVPNP